MRQSMPSEWQPKHFPARQLCTNMSQNKIAAMYRKMCAMIKIPLYNTWTSQESYCHLFCGSCRDCSICAGRGKLSLLCHQSLHWFWVSSSFFYKRAWLHISQQIPAAKLQFSGVILFWRIRQTRPLLGLEFHIDMIDQKEIFTLTKGWTGKGNKDWDSAFWRAGDLTIDLSDLSFMLIGNSCIKYT